MANGFSVDDGSEEAVWKLMGPIHRSQTLTLEENNSCCLYFFKCGLRNERNGYTSLKMLMRKNEGAKCHVYAQSHIRSLSGALSRC